eukprot:TRINITY_DN5916_c0_g1_i7.p1 TRINITY_DN5916_c0_g1~~TRINITY_DN5916_c0_g1_i7.p1  ORF type:complete len:386 (-),score=135.68 TRINITY_DN5916_c0_g1_i7:276-1433(-)
MCIRDRYQRRVRDLHLFTMFPATFQKPLTPPTELPPVDLEDLEGSFMRVGDVLIEEACKAMAEGYDMPATEVDWIRNMLEYNVKGGKANRGTMVVVSAKLLWEHQGRTIDTDTLGKMCVLGWCIEWMQAWLLVADDFMDSSKTRRGKVCWYLREDVKTVALNDAFTIEMLVYKLLKNYFVGEAYYLQLLDLFLETTMQTEVGQLADTLCMNMKISDFSVDRWTYIVKYKTSFYSFYLPVALAMIVGGVTEVEAYCKAREVLVKMGVYFQAQDDFLDAFADPETLGKIGTDIQDKKCGWLFVHAYNDLASAAQQQMFDEHYGKCEVGSTEEIAIKELYKEFGLEQLYHEYEAKTKVECEAMMDQLDPATPRSIFEAFLNKIFKRQK